VVELQQKSANIENALYSIFCDFKKDEIFHIVLFAVYNQWDK
jgi:hypothetical protein